MDQGKSLLMKDLELSVTGFPSGYNVSVGWNPISNTDVGWLTLKKGVSIDFKHLQLRDFNLNQLENISEKCGGSDQVIGDFQVTFTSCESVSRTQSVEKPQSHSEVTKFQSLLEIPKLTGQVFLL